MSYLNRLSHQMDSVVRRQLPLIIQSGKFYQKIMFNKSGSLWFAAFFFIVVCGLLLFLM